MKAAAIQSISTSEPLEIISMDFLHLDKTSGGHQYLLVVTDLFTKLTQSYATRNNEKLQQKYMRSSSSLVYLGKYCMIKERSLMTISSNILHNSVTSEKFEFHHIPLRPMAKQRMNQTIINMLKRSAERNKSNWKDHIQKLVHAYNCTTHSSTGCSSYYLLFDRTPKLPIDLIILSPATDLEQTTHLSYADKMEETDSTSI